MAIKSLVPQLAERGKIKIGEKGDKTTSRNGKEFGRPRKLDHFMITTMQRDDADRLMPDTALMDRLKKMVLVTTISPSKAFKILKANGIQAGIEPSGKIYYQAADEAKVREIFPNDANPIARSQSEERRLLEPDDASKTDPLGLEGSAVSDKVYQETQRTDPAEEELVPPGYDGLPAAAHTMNTRNTQRTKGASRERLF